MQNVFRLIGVAVMLIVVLLLAGCAGGGGNGDDYAARLRGDASTGMTTDVPAQPVTQPQVATETADLPPAETPAPQVIYQPVEATRVVEVTVEVPVERTIVQPVEVTRVVEVEVTPVVMPPASGLDESAEPCPVIYWKHGRCVATQAQIDAYAKGTVQP